MKQARWSVVPSGVRPMRCACWCVFKLHSPAKVRRRSNQAARCTGVGEVSVRWEARARRSPLDMKTDCPPADVRSVLGGRVESSRGRLFPGS